LPVPFQLEDLAAVLVRKMRDIQPEGPYLVGGWCLDGILAYETASQLLAEGQEVGLLVLFDAENPNPPHPRSSPWRQLIRRMRRHFTKFLQVTPTERLDYLRNRLRTRAVILKHLRWEVAYKLRLRATGNIGGLHRVFDSIEYLAACNYRPRPYPGRALLIRPDTALEAHFEMGWYDVVPGLEVYAVPGGHREMFMEPHVKTLAARLAACLMEA
jgi:thioesterase domain-containing protein